MDNKKTLELISDIIALLNSEEYDATIPAIAESCNIPIEYVRKFILQLVKNTILSACVTGEDPASYNSDNNFIDEYLDDEEGVSTNLLQGKYDHYLWSIKLKVLSLDEDQLLGLTAIEYGAIQSLGETDTSFRHGAIYEIKDNVTKVEKNIRKNQELIQTAINNHTAISFSYKNRKGIIENHIGFPVNLATSIADNWIYFELANNNSTYRLDRVTDTIKAVKNFGPFPEIEENPNKKYMWGSYFHEDAAPEHVKIVISDTRPNMIQKIQNDIRHRKELCSFYKQGDVYIYEDDIIGIPEFQRWIRGYGSSIQVIEPSYLRKDIIDKARKTLALYESAEAWKNL
ncbi:WYL domain-containing protein [Butyrivibrio sp. TB]|uniref:WYL domain-containing protein n=1 Tax=Butyrivibrio sp. TB TaxID=1520809 RepID=UPI0008BAFB85|nr:WYL domain-containing protein [Butyrivibrio sp. TB]SEQ69736.1 WYL domain-containing protein [Butyrivibrio sp. TB]